MVMDVKEHEYSNADGQEDVDEERKKFPKSGFASIIIWNLATKNRTSRRYKAYIDVGDPSERRFCSFILKNVDS